MHLESRPSYRAGDDKLCCNGSGRHSDKLSRMYSLISSVGLLIVVTSLLSPLDKGLAMIFISSSSNSKTGSPGTIEMEMAQSTSLFHTTECKVSTERRVLRALKDSEKNKERLLATCCGEQCPSLHSWAVSYFVRVKIESKCEMSDVGSVKIRGIA